jgi:hypothetical protein
MGPELHGGLLWMHCLESGVAVNALWMHCQLDECIVDALSVR